MVEVTVFVEADINPTEDAEKVRIAINNLLTNVTYTSEPAPKGSVIRGAAKGQDSLIKFRNLLRSDRIRDAARRLLFKSTHENIIVFYLNKQVAYAGHVSFSEETSESPLGPLYFKIETSDAQALIEWLAEKT